MVPRCLTCVNVAYVYLASGLPVLQHVRGDGAGTIGVTLARARNPATVTIVVSDSSSGGPVLRDTPPGDERGRGLQIVEALSAHWGWHPQDGGKAVFAILARSGMWPL